jgi:hypothetical protein
MLNRPVAKGEHFGSGSLVGLLYVLARRSAGSSCSERDGRRSGDARRPSRPLGELPLADWICARLRDPPVLGVK